VRSIGSIVAIMLTAFVLAEAALPSFVGGVLAGHIDTVAGSVLGIALPPVARAGAQSPAGTIIRVRSSPAVRLAFGIIDEITMFAGSVRIAGYEVDSAAIQMTGVRFDPRALFWGSGQMTVRYDDAIVVLEVNEAALSREIERMNLPLSSPRVTLSQGRVRITGKVSLLGQVQEIGLEGTLAMLPGEPRRIYLLPSAPLLNGKPLPVGAGPVVRGLLGDRLLLVDFDRQGIPLSFRDITVVPGRLKIVAGRKGGQ